MRDVQSQTLEIAVGEAVLGRPEPAVALRDAAAQATRDAGNPARFRG